MIQDIAPHKFDITYMDGQPKDDSVILFFHEGNILVGQHLDKKNNKIIFPSYYEFCRNVNHEQMNCGCKQENVGGFVYLFRLNEQSFFYYNVDKNEKPQQLVEQLNLQQDIVYEWQPRQFFRTALPKEYALAAVTAMHLDGWYRKNRYCGACGHPLIRDTKERMLRCEVCNNMVYPRINPAVIVGVTDGDRLLLTKYRGRAYKKYALVAGFTEIGESFEQTVAREVMEETGLKVKNIHYYKSQPWGFADNILAGYFCEVDGDPTIQMDQEELSVAEWFERDEIPVEPEDLSLTNEMIIHFKQGGANEVGL